jgi:hypothetical protein
MQEFKLNVLGNKVGKLNLCTLRLGSCFKYSSNNFDCFVQRILSVYDGDPVGELILSILRS